MGNERRRKSSLSKKKSKRTASEKHNRWTGGQQVGLPVAAPGQNFMPQELDFSDLPDDLFGPGPIDIRQQFEVLELIGCEAKNRYAVEGAQVGPMYISEDSKCLERICCGPNRALTMNVHYGYTRSHPIIYRFSKPFHCQGCCCLRPLWGIRDGESNFLGRIEDPCRVCSVDQKMFDEQGNHIYTTNGTCLQPGLHCKMGCCGAKFEIRDERGHEPGEVRKIPNGLSECLTQANHFRLSFPDGATGEEKALLLGQAMALDNEYFEVKPR